MFPLKKIEKYFPPIEIKKLKPKQNEKSLPSNYYAFDHLSISLTSSLKRSGGDLLQFRIAIGYKVSQPHLK